MATYRGFVRSIETRNDGWVECVLRAVHAGNQDRAFLIQGLDGDLEKINRRLAQLGLLRDALARTLPVEIQFTSEGSQGDLIEDVIIYPRPSFDGRQGARLVTGTVIGVSITERGPVAASSPYVDEADVAAATILTSSGSIEGVLVDLQRPDAMTGHAILELIREAHRTRRPLELMITSEFETDKPASHRDENDFNTIPGYVQTCRWQTVPEDDLDYLYAFVERMEQRWESYEASEAAALSHIEVVYTTSPGQTPEGDVSDNGTFMPVTDAAWVHADSPLVERLRDALRGSLQVKLGLAEGRLIHSVEVVSHLGSAARPIWIEIKQRAICPPGQDSLCDNVPTIQPPRDTHLNRTPYTVAWTGHGFFNEGIWRFVVAADGPVRLLIDGEVPCCDPENGEIDAEREDVVDSKERGIFLAEDGATMAYRDYSAETRTDERKHLMQQCIAHAYMQGVHRVDLQVSDRVCRSPFRFLVYRLR